MEKFHSAMSFSSAVNCAASVVSPTTMGDGSRLVNVVSSPSKSVQSLPPSCTEGRVVGVGPGEDASTSNRPEMKGNVACDDSVSRKLEASLSPETKQQIENLLMDIKKLDEKQKLWLYLQLPTGHSEQDPSHKSTSPMLSSSRLDQTTAVNWVRSHIEESTDTSLPKQEVYEEYRSFCESTSQRPLSAADFGKIIKNVFPAVQARRLGTRGNSRYCYSGMRKKLELTSPSLPPLDAPTAKHGMDNLPSPCPSCPTSLLSMEDDHLKVAAGEVICEWAAGIASRTFANSLQLAQHLTSNKLVSKSSHSILVVQSHMGHSEGYHRPDLTPEMRHKETNYQLKQTLQYRQEIRKRQAEENQQRLQEGTSPVSSKQAVARTEEELAQPQVLRTTDKVTHLEQKFVTSGGGEVVGANSTLLAESSESSTSTENQMSSSNATTGDGSVASKESPSKRRFAPIQPKTPVRDTSAPMLLLSPSNKSVGGSSSVQYYVVNGANGQKVIPLQNLSKLTSPQQIIVQQGQNVFQSPVQNLAAVGNQTPMNVVRSPLVGNTVISNPMIPAASIQNAIKNGQVLVVPANQLKQMGSVGSSLQSVSNANAAMRQNQAQNQVAPGQVAVVAQAAPPHPHQAMSSSSGACHKNVLSSQGINLNTGTTGYMRPQNMTPVLIEHSARAPGPSLTSPINVMAHAMSNQNTKLVSSSNVNIRTAPSCLVHVTNSPSIVASVPSTSTTSVTFATQPMKLLSSVAVIGSDSFQGNCVLSNISNAPQSGVDVTTNVPSQFAVTNPAVISSNKHTPLHGPTKTVVNTLPSEISKSSVNNTRSSLIQNGGGKTVASLLRSAQASASQASASLPKQSMTSTLAEIPSGFVLAQVQLPQGVANQRDGQNVQHILIRTAPDDGSSSVALSDRDVGTTATVGGQRVVVMGHQELANLRQSGLLSKLLAEQGGVRQQGNNIGVTLPQMSVEDASSVINQMVAQPSGSLLPEAENTASPMLMVSGMSAATMLPNRSKPGEMTLISQMQTAPAITTSQQRDTLAALFGKQRLAQVQTTQPKMLERLLASENLSYINAPLTERSARSVPTTPIAELQSPPPHLIHRAQSAAMPMHQGQGDSVPPSPSDGKTFAFTPINMIELEGEYSPHKPKHKPKATHPGVRSLLNQALLSSDSQDQVQDANSFNKGKGKRTPQPEFATPTRKRRLSNNSKRLAASSPSSVQFQGQVRQNVASPAPNQMAAQQQILIHTTQATPGMTLSSRTVPLNSTFPAGSGHNQHQQAVWQRRRNPSGPACPSTLNTQTTTNSFSNAVTQEQIETEIMNLLNNTGSIQNLFNKQALQNRSQSVPLPDHAASRLLQFQGELAQAQNALDANRGMASHVQVIPVMPQDQVSQVQNGPASSFAAKRNLTQDLLDIDVTEEDFAPVNNLLNTEINPQQVSDLSDTSWAQSNGQTAVETESNVNSHMADFALKYDDLADQQNGNHGQLQDTQSLLPSNQAFNDTSNSTASSISDTMIMDDLKVFEELDEGETFGLPPTPWQMGNSSSNLPGLECGM